MDRSLHRFILDGSCFGDGGVRISGDQARQIATVLRLEPGDRFVAVDGRGSAMIVAIAEVSSSLVTGTVVETCRLDTEPMVRLTIAQSVPKGDRLEFVIQKGTELGVVRFELVSTARTIARPPEDRVAGKLTRWRSIAREAAEQSCRAIVPEVVGIGTLADLARRIPEFDLALCLWESERQARVRDILRQFPDSRDVLVIVGPEGGFLEEEVRLVTEAGARAVSLGPRVLRCETAAITAAAIVVYELG
jgi:16S rRNA (uracil1498-N3)-methyltransferase